MRRIALMCALLAGSASAADLPCGGEEHQGLTVSWRVPAGDPTTYRLYWSNLSMHWNEADSATQHILAEVSADVATSGARLTAEFLGATPATQPIYVVMTALNAGGESSHSNELEVPATSSGVCPPRPGTPTELRLESITVTLPDGTTRTLSAEELRTLLP